MRKQYENSKEQSVKLQTDVLYQRNSNYILREIAGEYILVPTGNELMKFNGLATMNETAMFLWELFEEQRSLEEILKCFGNEYELTDEECAEDVQAFLTPALEQGVILRCDEECFR